jgi:hypothetical protein
MGIFSQDNRQGVSCREIQSATRTGMVVYICCLISFKNMRIASVALLIFFVFVGTAWSQSETSFHAIVVKDERPSQRRSRLIDYDCDFAWVGQGFGDSRDLAGNTVPGVFVHSHDRDLWLQILRVSTVGAKFGKSPKDAIIQAGWDFTRLASREFVPLPLPDGGLPNPGGQVIHLPDKVTYDRERDAFVMYFDSRAKIDSMTTTVIIPKKDLVEAFEYYAGKNRVVSSDPANH